MTGETAGGRADNSPNELEHDLDRDPTHPLRCALAYLQVASIRLGNREEPGQAMMTADAARANLEDVLDAETEATDGDG